MESRWLESQDPLSVTLRTWWSPRSFQDLAKTWTLCRYKKCFWTKRLHPKCTKMPLATQIQFRLTPTVWTSRVCSSERIDSFLGTSAANQERPEMAGFKKLSYHTSGNNRRGWNLMTNLIEDYHIKYMTKIHSPTVLNTGNRGNGVLFCNKSFLWREPTDLFSERVLSI